VPPKIRQSGIEVIIGTPDGKPEEVVTAYLKGELTTDANPCDNSGFHGNKSYGD